MSPDYNLLAREFWGSGHEVAVAMANASNVVIGTNPPWSPADFLAMYPKFGSAPDAPPFTGKGTLAAGSAVITEVEEANSVQAGQLIIADGIPGGTTIVSVDSETEITISQNATKNGPTMLTVYVKPLVPLAVIRAYIAFASASLVYARWQDSWPIGMALFVAHYLTLWLRSDGNTFSTAGQAAAAGLAHGIAVSESAGPVSISSQVVSGLENWASWNETDYGKQFATIAKIIGMGPMFIW